MTFEMTGLYSGVPTRDLRSDFSGAEGKYLPD